MGTLRSFLEVLWELPKSWFLKARALKREEEAGTEVQKAMVGTLSSMHWLTMQIFR